MPQPEPPTAGQESAWDYPRPAVLERNQRHILIRLHGEVLADTRGGFRVLETSHPPTYCLPIGDVKREWLRSVPGRGTFCEWKGFASYFDIVSPAGTLQRACWTYPNPTESFAGIVDHLAFYAAPMDSCSVDGELVTPQEGPFYGGWITSHVAGPFKGPPGTEFW